MDFPPLAIGFFEGLTSVEAIKIFRGNSMLLFGHPSTGVSTIDPVIMQHPDSPVLVICPGMIRFVEAKNCQPLARAVPKDRVNAAKLK